MAIERSPQKYTKLSVAEYSGYARFGEVIIDISNPAAPSMYIGNATGQLVPSGGGGGGGSPGGAPGSIQFNSGGTFGGAPGITTDGTNLAVAGTITATGGFVGNIGDANSNLTSNSFTSNTANITTIISNTITSNTLISNTANITTINSDTVNSNTVNANTVVSNVGNITTINSNVINANTANIANISSNTITANTGNLGNLNVSGIANLGNVGNVKIFGGSNNQVLTTDGTGNLSWKTVDTGNVTSNTVTSNTIISNVGNIVTINSDTVNANTLVSNVGNITTINSNLVNANTANITTINSNVVNANTLVSNVGNITTINSNLVNANTLVSNVGNITTINSDTVNSNLVNANTLVSNVGNITTINSNLVNANTGNIVTINSNVVNSNVVNANTITANGNITGGNLVTSGDVFANNGTVFASNVNANVVTANTGTFGNITVTGTTTTSNISGGTTGVNITAGGTNQNIVLDPSGTGYVSASNATISNVATPVNANDAATKAYVDAIAQGLNTHQAADVATTGPLTATYNNGAAGIGATLTLGTPLTTLDGYTLVVGDRVLVKNQSDAKQNGVYVYNSSTSLMRASDFDNSTANQVVPGDLLFVSNGSTQGSTSWVQNALGTGTNESIIIGTDNITFAQFGAAGSYGAGTGLNLSGSTFSIANTTVTAAAYGSGDLIPTFTVNQQGQLTAAANVTNAPNAANLTGNTLASGVINSSLTSVGTLGNLNVSGNILGNNITANNTVTANTVVANIGNITTINSDLITANTGNIANLNSNVIIANTANISGNVTANGLVANTANIGGDLTTGANANITGNLNVTGNITGTFVGNISGNIAAPGSNSQIIFNQDGNLGAHGNLNYNRVNQQIIVPNAVFAGQIQVGPYLTGNANSLILYGGSNGQFLQTNGSGSLVWANAGVAVPGSDTQIIFNDGGNLGADSALTYNKTTDTLALAGTADFRNTTANAVTAPAMIVNNGEESVSISSVGLGIGTVNLYFQNGVTMITANATGNWTFNMRFNPNTTMNAALFFDSASSTGGSMTTVAMVKQGSPAYYANAFQVDGVSVTPLWQGGTAPTSGNANGYDVYSFTVVKTSATPTYTVFASQTQFK